MFRQKTWTFTCGFASPFIEWAIRGAMISDRSHKQVQPDENWIWKAFLRDHLEWSRKPLANRCHRGALKWSKLFGLSFVNERVDCIVMHDLLCSLTLNFRRLEGPFVMLTWMDETPSFGWHLITVWLFLWLPRAGCQTKALNPWHLKFIHQFEQHNWSFYNFKLLLFQTFPNHKLRQCLMSSKARVTHESNFRELKQINSKTCIRHSPPDWAIFFDFICH